MNFDIKKLSIQETAKFHVMDAHGEMQYDDQGNAITITAHSPGTRKAARAQFKRDESRSARVMGQMAGKSSKRNEQDDINERAEFLAEVTVSLDNFEFPGGPRALYSDLPLGHVANDFEKWWNDRGNFAPSSENSSSST